jgi:hypothetical protein
MVDHKGLEINKNNKTINHSLMREDMEVEISIDPIVVYSFQECL